MIEVGRKKKILNLPLKYLFPLEELVWKGKKKKKLWGEKGYKIFFGLHIAQRIDLKLFGLLDNSIPETQSL